MKALCLMFALGCALAVRGGSAAEGKWTPEQVLEQDREALRGMGLELPPEALWGREGAGLLEAAVRISGCSAGFVSSEGLLITNHHCAFAILQQHSTPRRDLTTHGYLASGLASAGRLARGPAGTPAAAGSASGRAPSTSAGAASPPAGGEAAESGAELPGSGVRATIPHRTIDVTSEVEAAAASGPAGDDLARYRAIERKKKELVAACEQQESRRCEVATFDGGVRYLLIESLEYPDVRLVYAPPRAVGDFGGEVDNWSWPRHAGDFALLRVYASPDGRPAPYSPANVPYHPRHFFPVATRGVQEGDFVMVVGYPGVTFRSLTAAEMSERGELYFPRRAELYRSWIDIMEAASRKDEAARIALADRIKGLANGEKNSRGQVAGLRRGRILERKAEAEREVLAWAAGRPEQAAAVAAHAELDQLVAAHRALWEHDFLLELARTAAKPLDLALTLVRRSEEVKKPDLEREPVYMERDRDRLKESLVRDQKRFHLGTEVELLTDLFSRMDALPEDARVPAVASFLGPPDPATAARAAQPGGQRTAAIRARVAGALSQTRVTVLEQRMAMFDESEDQLRARHDPLLDLAFALDHDLRAAEEHDHRHRGATSRLRPAWQRAVAAHAGRPLAPDANGTLRVSWARVRGYSPRDGMWMQPLTTVAGMAEKNTGEDPFNAPTALVAAASSAPASPWADSALHQVPVNFLADADTSGGSSGSPVLNGRGELVGVNFDRVWENVANDFGYNPDVARNISVDFRYLLWVLTTLHGSKADPLLRELGIAPVAQARR